MGVLQGITYYIRDAQGNVMSVYTKNPEEHLTLTEQHLYGSARLGMHTKDIDMTTTGTFNDEGTHASLRGEKSFELSNHLGNVLSVITDQKLTVASTSTIDHFISEVVSYTDYYPFGAPMDHGASASDRSWSGYRFGFQNQEQDSELWEGTVTFKYRIEDARLGRFFSVDPLAAKYPYYSSYQFSGNRLIDMIELEGLEPTRIGNYEGDYDIAEDNVECGNYGWSWDGCNWIRGESTDFKVGNAQNDSPDFDLSCDYFPDQRINDWQNCSDELNIGTDCHLFNFYGMYSNGIMLESDAAEAEAMMLFKKFCSGGEGSFTSPLFFGSDSEIATILKQDYAFVSLTNAFANAANAYLECNGSLDGFDGDGILSYLRRQDQCSYMKGTWYMHTIMGGYCQIDISIIGVKNGKVLLSTTIYDHFGAGRNDANVATPGLPSMYYLQHNTPINNKYKPFVWSVNVR